MAQFKGEVCWFNHAKGYGFVTSDETKDVFFHYSALQKDGYKTINEGEKVEFDVVQGDTGKRQAANVHVLPASGDAQERRDVPKG